MTIEMKPVKSSNIDSVGYDEATSQMHIKFKTGGHYKYDGVPKEAHEAFMAAESHGKHLIQNFAGKFKHTKIDADG